MVCELMPAATEDPPRHFLVADAAMCVHLTRDREQSMVSISQVLPRGNSFARGLQLPVDLDTRSGLCGAAIAVAQHSCVR